MDVTLIAVIVALLVGLVGAYLVIGQKPGGGGTEERDNCEVPQESTAKAKDAKGKGGALKGPPPKKPKDPKAAAHPLNICSIKGHASDILQARFSGSCKLACTVAEDRKLIIWDLKSLPPTQLMNMPIEFDHGVGCAFSPDDKFVAVALSRSREVKIYKTKGAKEGPQVTFATGHTAPILSLDWSFDGKFIVTYSDDPKDTVRVFRPNGEPLGKINPGALVVYSCAVSPDSRFISIASMQCESKIWEVAAGKDGYKVSAKSVMELTGRSGGGGATGHTAAVQCVDFGGCSPGVLNTESKDAVTVSKDGTCKVWNIDVRYKFNEDPKCTLTFASPDNKAIDLVSISKGKTSQWVATYSATVGLNFYSLPGGGLTTQIPPVQCGGIVHMAFAPGPIGGHECVLSTVHGDGKVRLWVPKVP